MIEVLSSHSWETICDGGADNEGSKSRFHENSVPSSIAHESTTVNVQSPFNGDPIKSANEELPDAP